MSSGRELAVTGPSGQSNALVTQSVKAERRLAHSIESIRAEIGELVISMRTEPERQEENTKQLQILMGRLKEVDEKQTELHKDIDTQRSELEKIRAKHVKEMKNEKAKQAKPVLMAELRALGQLRLTPEDEAARQEQAQKPKAIVASGGLTGFRVASDLFKMDYGHEGDEDPDAWRASKAKK
ncbi:hypothetical protein WJX73_005707 [Symbiochloris irregularis]|uniref:Uncharacterized protein n=1 Tax=Symbiochloris irregularis TaxID=706552 RepID=A0AAW1PJB7_9CHLO